VDVEAALEAVHRAESAVARQRWHEAWGAALGARLVAARRAPFRESGYRLLMEAQAARGNVAEALHVYERLRVLLREELGVAPSPAVQAVHRRLLLGAAD
jgi:DNA-binding SARP family transcriptional activator